MWVSLQWQVCKCLIVKWKFNQTHFDSLWWLWLWLFLAIRMNGLNIIWNHILFWPLNSKPAHTSTHLTLSPTLWHHSSNHLYHTLYIDTSTFDTLIKSVCAWLTTSHVNKKLSPQQTQGQIILQSIISKSKGII